jgi:predicted transcriptional regulator of viral defense system
MGHELPIAATPRRQMASRHRVADLAARQAGRITTQQLNRCGVSSSAVSRWVRAGFLHRRRRGVYAVGHVAGGESADLAEALLVAGPGAALSHTTGAWWRGLLRYASPRVHVCTPNRRRSTKGVQLHHPREMAREWHRGLPVMPVTELLLEIAPIVGDAGLRRALAVADRNGWLDLAQVHDELQRRPRGAIRLRHALDHHMPQLADTLSPLEDRFFIFCERHGIPLPEANYDIAGYAVDAVWPDAGVAVGLDGRNEHGTPAAVVRDRRRELTIRGERFTVIRYGSEQIDDAPDPTARDLKAALSRLDEI